MLPGLPQGLTAGLVNLALFMRFKTALPPLFNVIKAMLVGFFAYGISLTLFVVGLRHLGTARTGTYFSVAPFIGAVLAVMMGESVTIPFLIAGVLMGIGVWLHLIEKHEHIHTHHEIEHEHEHSHDEHHQHPHDFPVNLVIKHSHRYEH